MNDNFNFSPILSFIGLSFFVVKLIQHNCHFFRSGYSSPNIWTLRDGWGTGEGRESVPNFHHRLDSQYLFQLVKRFYIKNVSVGLSLHKIGVLFVAPIKYQCTKLSYINMKQKHFIATFHVKAFAVQSNLRKECYSLLGHNIQQYE